MSTNQDDTDDIFGLSLAPAGGAQPIVGGAAPSKESRKEPRIKVKWAARVQLSDGRVAQLQLCDISETGIGLTGEVGIPANSLLTCAVAVPDLNDPSKITPVVGTIRTAHTTVRGQDLIYGGTWITIDADSRELLKKWIRRLRS
jgi:hypothetical protein